MSSQEEIHETALDLAEQFLNESEQIRELVVRGTEGRDYVIVEPPGGKRMVVPIRKENESYDPNPQIRAYQLVHERKFGGNTPGQRRPRKNKRLAEIVADAARARHNLIIDAFDEALTGDNIKLRMEAATKLLEIENKEANLQLKEDESALETQTKEDLIATLFEIAASPSASAVESIIELPESAVREISKEEYEETGEASASNGSNGTDPTAAGSRTPRKAKKIKRKGSAPAPKKARVNIRSSGRNATGATEGTSKPTPSAFRKAANRRPAK